MKYTLLRRHSFVVLSLIVLVLFTGCKNDSGDPTGLTLPEDPGPGNLAGIIVGTVNGTVIPGVIVSVGAVSMTTDADGYFRLDGVGEGILNIVLQGDGIIYTRTTSVNTANGRSIFLDAIEVNSDFNLGFYREIARKNHPEEGEMNPTRRWVTQPTFYIDLNYSAVLDGEIDQETKNMVKDVLTEMVPIWSGGKYTAGSIQERFFDDFDELPENAIVITFDDLLYFYVPGALGGTLSEANVQIMDKAIIILLDSYWVQILSGEAPDRVFSHELGHAFGFQHTSLLPSIMPKYAPLPEFLYSEADKLHAGVMYRRAPGNTDIDDDPSPGAKLIDGPSGWQIHIDRIPNPPTLSSEMYEGLKRLQGRGKLERYLQNKSITLNHEE